MYWLNFLLVLLFSCISGMEELCDGYMDLWQTNLVELYEHIEDVDERNDTIELRQKCRSDREIRNHNLHQEYFDLLERVERLGSERPQDSQ